MKDTGWLFSKSKCKRCGRGLEKSVKIKGNYSFRSCQYGWIIKIPKKLRKYSDDVVF